MASTIITNAIKTSLAEALFNEIASNRARYYYCIGKPVSWPDDENPPDPINSISKERDARGVLILSKKVQTNDAVLVSRRIDWNFGTIYERYDDQAVNLEDQNFYAITSEFAIYKCLDNNNRAESTVEPFGFDIDPIETDDGYRWKYIYSIPPQLRTKFLSNSFFPVVNAITSQYYSRGSISSVRIKSAGAGYTQNNTSILVSGNGFLEANPVRLTSVNLDNLGSGYTTTPTVDITRPFSNAFEFIPSVIVSRGTVVRSNGNYYRALNTGTLGAASPIHFAGEASNGTVTLEYTATESKGYVTINATAFSGAFIVEGGSGYTSVPSVIIAGNGNSATAIAQVENQSISSITVINNGTGYTTATVTIGEPVTGYTAFTPSTAVVVDAILKTNTGGVERYYRVVVAGTTGSAPTHTSGSASSGSASLLFLATRARANAVFGVVNAAFIQGYVDHVDIPNQGTGYTTATVSFSGGGGSGAAGNAILSAGKIVGVIITNRGVNYITPPTVTITGNGTGALVNAVLEFGYGYSNIPSFTIAPSANPNGVTAEVSVLTEKTEAIIEPIITSGQLVGVNVINGGVGYTNAILSVIGDGFGAEVDALLGVGDLSSAQSNTELFTTPLGVSGIFVEEGGFNISSVRLDVIGDGTGAQAEAVLENGVIVSVRVLSQGTGYSYAYVNAMLNEGATQPILRVVITPPKGHGYDPVKELYASSIALFSSFAGELNHGIEVTNDQRQVSIIRNPFKFGEDSFIDRPSASTCFKATVLYSSIEAVLDEDDVVIRESDGAAFRVIQTSGDEILLQEIDTAIIQPNDRFEFNVANTPYFFTVSEVVLPQIDKYSGDFLFLNNVRPFVVTENQAITVRTLITL